MPRGHSTGGATHTARRQAANGPVVPRQRCLEATPLEWWPVRRAAADVQHEGRVCGRHDAREPRWRGRSFCVHTADVAYRISLFGRMVYFRARFINFTQPPG